MRTAFFIIVTLLFGFIGYGLYLSWGINLVIAYAAVIVLLAMVVYYRLKSPEETVAEDEQDEVNEKENIKSIQPVLQDPDALLQKFRSLHQSHDVSKENKIETPKLRLEDDEEAFQRAVKELKKVKHSENSMRMQWVNKLEQETQQFAERTRFKTPSPMMKQLNSLFIMNAFLYLRVFVNLIDISIKMGRVNSSCIERLDHDLAQLSKSEYERLSRVIVIHYLDLFLSDHSTSTLFDDTFSRRSFTQSIMEGLGYGKQETLMLQAIKTDTEYIRVLLLQLRLDPEQPFVDLAKTAFENTSESLKEKIIQSMQKLDSMN